MNTSEIEKKLVEMDKQLHDILNMIEERKKNKEGVVEAAIGAWGYDVDSVEFARNLRKSTRTDRSS